MEFLTDPSDWSRNEAAAALTTEAVVSLPRLVVEKLRRAYLLQQGELRELRIDAAAAHSKDYDHEQLEEQKQSLLQGIRKKQHEVVSEAKKEGAYRKLMEKAHRDMPSWKRRMKEVEESIMPLQEKAAELRDLVSLFAAANNVGEEGAVLRLDLLADGLVGVSLTNLRKLMLPIRTTMAGALGLPASTSSCCTITCGEDAPGNALVSTFFYLPEEFRQDASQMTRLRTVTYAAVSEGSLQKVLGARVSHLLPLRGQKMLPPKFLDGCIADIPQGFPHRAMDLGFTMEGKLPGQMRVSLVGAGTWAQCVGINPGDLLLWCNERPQGEFTYPDLLDSLATVRPLRLYFGRQNSEQTSSWERLDAEDKAARQRQAEELQQLGRGLRPSDLAGLTQDGEHEDVQQGLAVNADSYIAEATVEDEDLGVVFAEMHRTTCMREVRTVVGESWGEACGILPGDLLVAIGGVDLASLDEKEVSDRLAKKRPLTLTLMRKTTKAQVNSATIIQAHYRGKQARDFVKVEKMRPAGIEASDLLDLMQDDEDEEVQIGKAVAAETYIVEASTEYPDIHLHLQGEPAEKLVIARVHPDTWCEQAGIIPGDVLVALNGKTVSTMTMTEVQDHVVGTRPLQLTLVRRNTAAQVDAATKIQARFRGNGIRANMLKVKFASAAQKNEDLLKSINDMSEHLAMAEGRASIMSADVLKIKNGTERRDSAKSSGSGPSKKRSSGSGGFGGDGAFAVAKKAVDSSASPSGQKAGEAGTGTGTGGQPLASPRSEKSGSDTSSSGSGSSEAIDAAHTEVAEKAAVEASPAASNSGEASDSNSNSGSERSGDSSSSSGSSSSNDDMDQKDVKDKDKEFSV